MESRETVLMILFTGQQWKHRYREQTYRHSGVGERNGWDQQRDNMETYVKQTASGNLLHDSGNSNRGSVTTLGDGLGWEVGGKFKREGA